MNEPFIEVKARSGKCYELSGKVVLTWKKWTLVHGFVRMNPGSDERIMAHAWTEKDDTVHDPVLNQNVAKDRYYSIYVPSDCEIVRYTSKEAAQKMITEGHFGSWEKSFDEWSDRRLPFTLDEYVAATKPNRSKHS